MDRPTCETCPYAEDPGGNIVVECHRRVPASIDEKTKSPLWPLISLDHDWCGEHPDFPAWIASRGKAGTPTHDHDGPMIGELDRVAVIEALSVRARKALYCLPQDLRITNVTPDMMVNIRGCGRTTYLEIRNWIRATYGFTALA